jgi:hypothetical protein
MSDYVVGDTISGTFVLRDNANVALIGKTDADFATVEAYLAPTGSPTVAVTLGEIGGGEYGFSFVPTVAGSWTVHFIYDSGGVFREPSGDYLVAAASGSGATSGAITVTTGTRLDEIRRRVGLLLRDYTEIEATADGTMSTVVDSLNLNAESGDWMHAQLLCSGGTALNLGEKRRVLGNVQASGTISLAVDLPTNTQEGDTFDLFCLRGQGFLIQHYDRAIKTSIDNARNEYHVALGPTTLVSAFAFDNPDITLPDEYEIVYRVEYQDEAEDWVEIPVAKRPGLYAEGWFAQGLSGTIRVEGCYRDWADGRAIRVLGYGPHPSVSEDSDLIALDQEWVILTAAARLAARKTPAREWMASAAGWTQEANGRRLAMHIPYLPNSTQIR